MEKITLNKTNSSWSPKIGGIANQVVKRNKIEEKESETIIGEALDILSDCGEPDSIHNQTGLAVGYVQSGKTLSFTTLTSLAIENGYDVIILIAGTTNKLVDQTFSRTQHDIGVIQESGYRLLYYKNPNPTTLYDDLHRFYEQDKLFGMRTIAHITVMKHYKHIDNLYKVFKTGKIQRSVLIIDDEADQASLNTKARKKDENELSATYASIKNLRKSIEKHAFVQYTATPQAPLFISVLDILSPSFVKVLTPGGAYTGGKTFFARNPDSKYPLIKTIPHQEIYHPENNPLTAIPDSLVKALNIFYLTCGIGIHNGHNPIRHNRTMMIHPHREIKYHNVYKRWVKSYQERIIEELALPDSDPDKKGLLKSFEECYKDLESTDSSIPNFAEIVNKLLPVIKSTPILTTNSKTEESLDWTSLYSVILVGGQILDRGFTVEGLNITYMPRSLGTGNADTIQQRCRFFGYKKNYIGLCRVYLPVQSLRAYIDYNIHEEDVRIKLGNFSGKDVSLKEMKRVFILSKDLNITRRNVISDDLYRFRLSKWRPLDRIEPNNLDSNNSVIRNYLSSLSWGAISSFEDRPIQNHSSTKVSIGNVLDKLLLELEINEPNNSILVNSISSLLAIIYENDQSQHVNLVHMSNGLVRERSITNDKVKNLFQGKNPRNNYPGDRFYHSNDSITIQFHLIRIDGFNEFYTLAFYLPDGYSQSVISLD